MSRKRVELLLFVCLVLLFYNLFNVLFSNNEGVVSTTQQRTQQKCDSYIVYNPVNWVGLANRLFYYASFLGINRHLKKCPCALDITQPPFNYLTSNLTLTICPDELNLNRVWTLRERAAQIYTPGFFTLRTGEVNVTLYQYLHSWRYFWSELDQIRFNLLYNVHDVYRNQCDYVWRTQVLLSQSREHSNDMNNNNNNNNKNFNCVRIGVHVRRGDFITLGYLGFVPANKDYLLRAIYYFANRFFCMLLVVIGEDNEWNTMAFNELQPILPGNVNFMILQPSEEPYIDMCLLARCDHTIMTTGTFGWWAAALAGGEVTYQRQYFQRGTAYELVTNADDLYPPNWVPL